MTGREGQFFHQLDGGLTGYLQVFKVKVTLYIALKNDRLLAIDHRGHIDASREHLQGTRFDLAGDLAAFQEYQRADGAHNRPILLKTARDLTINLARLDIPRAGSRCLKRPTAPRIDVDVGHILDSRGLKYPSRHRDFHRPTGFKIRRFARSFREPKIVGQAKLKVRAQRIVLNGAGQRSLSDLANGILHGKVEPTFNIGELVLDHQAGCCGSLGNDHFRRAARSKIQFAQGLELADPFKHEGLRIELHIRNCGLEGGLSLECNLSTRLSSHLGNDTRLKLDVALKGLEDGPTTEVPRGV